MLIGLYILLRGASILAHQLIQGMLPRLPSVPVLVDFQSVSKHQPQ